MTMFAIIGVPIRTLLILAVPPKLNFRYSVQAEPSRRAGDQADNEFLEGRN